MKRWLSEPMLHFAVAAALLFAVHALAAGGRPDAAVDRSVHVGADAAAWLRGNWVRQWQREPTASEFSGLVTEYLKEELLVREARALGLDEDDTVVRRRLAQKLEFIVQDSVRLAEPSADDLRHYYDSHPELFRLPARAHFSQVYFSHAQRADAQADAAAVLATLSGSPASVDASALGDGLMEGADGDGLDESAVAARYGADFARALFALEPGQWRGPIESAYGYHLVRVERIAPAGVRAFDEVRTQVQARWRSEREREVGERYFAALQDKYEVTFDASIGPLVGTLQHAGAGPGADQAELR